jgi:mycoredoxin
MSDTRETQENPGVVMYCRTWCGDCARARRWLAEHNIPYTEVDVEADPAARDRAAGHNDGRLHTPTFEIGDGVCVDFRPDRLSELLGLNEREF